MSYKRKAATERAEAARSQTVEGAVSPERLGARHSEVSARVLLLWA